MKLSDDPAFEQRALPATFEALFHVFDHILVQVATSSAPKAPQDASALIEKVRRDSDYWEGVDPDIRLVQARIGQLSRG